MSKAPPNPDAVPPTPGPTSVEPCDILVLLEREERISATARRLCERYVRAWGVSAIDALTRTHVIPEAELANALAEILKIDRLYHVGTLSLAEESLTALPFGRAREWEGLIIRMENVQDAPQGDVAPGPSLELVLADPTRTDRINEIKQRLKCELALSVAERSDIVRAIDELYPLSAQLPSLYAAPASPAPAAPSTILDQ